MEKKFTNLLEIKGNGSYNEQGIAVLLVRSATKVRQDLIDACPGLKMIGRGGVGMDNIDVDYANKKGVELFNSPEGNRTAVAEHAMGMLLSLLNHLKMNSFQVIQVTVLMDFYPTDPF